MPQLLLAALAACVIACGAPAASVVGKWKTVSVTLDGVTHTVGADYALDHVLELFADGRATSVSKFVPAPPGQPGSVAMAGTWRHVDEHRLEFAWRDLPANLKATQLVEYVLNGNTLTTTSDRATTVSERIR